MQDEGVIYVTGHPLLNRRRTRLQGYFRFPNHNFVNKLTDINLLTKLILKARYSFIVLKVPLNPKQSVNLCLLSVYTLAASVRHSTRVFELACCSHSEQ